MESKAIAALNRLKEIDKKYKHKKISSDSSKSSDEGKVLRPTLNIKLPNPYEEYIESNTDESEHIVVRVIDDTPKARSRQSSDDNSEDAVKSVKEDDAKDIEDSSSREEISEIIEDVSETVQEVTDKSFNGHFNLDDGVIDAEDVGKNESDEILTDKYSKSFESPDSDVSKSQSVKVRKSNSVSESVETKSSSLNNSRSNKSLESIASGTISEKVLSEVEIEKKLSSESVKLSSDIVEDNDENKLPSLELIQDNFCNDQSKKTEEKSSSSKYESSNTKHSSHNFTIEKSKKIFETIQTISDNKFSVPTIESDEYISESTKIYSHKSIVKKNKKSSDSRQSVSNHEFIISKSETNDSSSEYIKSSSHKSIVKKSKKNNDVRQTVSGHEGYSLSSSSSSSSSKKKYPKNIPNSSRNLEKKLIQSHCHFKQEQQRLNSAMINYIQKIEVEHQRLLTWPKNLICPSRVNVKTVKPLEFSHISGFVRPDFKFNKDEDINMEILRNRLLDIRQWIKDQYVIYKEHYDLADSLNKTYTSYY